MKKNKIVTPLFFIVVFGFPVGWYLFLQTFGENKFDLPVIQAWDDECYNERDFVYLNVSDSVEHPNEIARLRVKLSVSDNIKNIEFSDNRCALNSDNYLVDEEGNVRGAYELTRLDIDRFAAELDIYLLNKANKHE